MLHRKILFLGIFGAFKLKAISLSEPFTQKGYYEIHDQENGADTYEALYTSFDELIEFLRTYPAWKHKLYSAKERFLRTPQRNNYSTDFFGFFDESEREGRRQVAFYYSAHFHEFISAHYPEINKVPEIAQFLEACFKIQKPYETLFEQASEDLGLKPIIESTPILLKVIKYLPSYKAAKPHYDGSLFSLFLDSTDNSSLLLSHYKSSFSSDDFSCPLREYSRSRHNNSILLIPGTQLTEFSIYPTPHIVLQSGTTRYATIAFAMRPNCPPQKMDLAPLPFFKID